MAVVAVAQPVPSSEDTTSDREIWATVAYYYPQYTLKEASKLPARDIKLLIKTAKKLEAQKMFNLTQIAAAPHTKKGEGVKKLSEHFKRLAK
jgi:hypothetical protein|nr:MAG TPA: hypothetical protein [Caudoviricetes sp.]